MIPTINNRDLPALTALMALARQIQIATGLDIVPALIEARKRRPDLYRQLCEEELNRSEHAA